MFIFTLDTSVNSSGSRELLDIATMPTDKNGRSSTSRVDLKEYNKMRRPFSSIVAPVSPPMNEVQKVTEYFDQTENYTRISHSGFHCRISVDTLKRYGGGGVWSTSATRADKMHFVT